VHIVHTTIANAGMKICGSKKPNSNFENETSSEKEFNLLDVVNTPRESLPKSASHIASNSQTYTTIRTK
jgi:hypothetical protein